MLTAWRAGADSGGIFFYLLGRAWFALFGPSEVSFRLFSASGIYLGLAVLWFTLRRHYPQWLLAPLLFAVWFAPYLTVLHVIEGRFYGLLLGAAGLVFLAAVLTINAERITPRLLLASFLSNLLLTGVHPFGAVFSGAMLVAIVVADLLKHRLRVLSYVSVAAGWSVLLFSREAMRNLASFGKPHFWITRPNISDLLSIYTQSSSILRSLMLLAILAILMALLTGRLRLAAVVSELLRQRAALLPALMILLVPACMWGISQVSRPLFLARYLLPVNIALVVLQVELWTVALVLPSWRRGLVVAAAFAMAIICMVGVARRATTYLNILIWPAVNFTGALLQQLPGDLPIVIERSDVFDIVLAQQWKTGRPIRYLLDWQNAVAPDSPLGDVSGYREMEVWRKVGFFGGSISDWNRFLADTPDFYVVDDPKERWFEHRLQSNPQWEVVRLGPFRVPSANPLDQDQWQATLWRVHRRTLSSRAGGTR